MRRLGRDVAALLLGAALAMGSVPTHAVAEASGRATAREEGVVADPEGVESEDAEAAGDALDAKADPEAEDPSEPEAGAVSEAPEEETGSDPSEPEAETVAAPSLPDLFLEVPSGDLASEALGAVEYVDEDGTARICNLCTDISAVKGNVLEGGWYVVRESRSFDGNVEIHGDVNLILCDGATLRCERGVRNSGKCGSRSLTIWGQSEGTGRLVADARKCLDREGLVGVAGIGGFYGEDGGRVVVHGGKVEAHGGDWAAGIGGGECGRCGTVTVNGGYVEAHGGQGGAGIGGGDGGSGGAVTITGGTVRANVAPGDDPGTDVGIFGPAAGIGGGEEGAGGTIAITGGDVLAKGSNGAAGIGGGENGDGGNVTISGGRVVAYGSVEDDAGAGIGGGDEGDGGHVTIRGGDVRAYGGHDEELFNSDAAAGIGGGDWADGGTVEIHGGTVRAVAGYADGTCERAWGAGIGGGDDAGAGTVTIDGGHVIARGYQAIGHGDGGDGGGVRVDGSKVRVLSGSVTGVDVELTDLIEEGTCGGCAWCLDLDGALTVEPADGVSGTLANADHSADFTFPWLAHAGEIRSAAFAQGVSLPAYSDRMFDGCSSLESVDASGCDASGVRSLFAMFRGCSSLASLDLSGWRTSALEGASCLFKGCASLATLDLSGLDLSNARFAGAMFLGCSSLSRITVGERFDASRAFPKATSDTKKWWSASDLAWYTVVEIASSRAHVADTYLSFEQSA